MKASDSLYSVYTMLRCSIMLHDCVQQRHRCRFNETGANAAAVVRVHNKTFQELQTIVEIRLLTT